MGLSNLDHVGITNFTLNFRGDLSRTYRGHGRQLRGIGIGEVIESHRKDMKPGDLVFGLTGWQDYAIVDDATNELPFTILPAPLPESLTAWLGPLGHTGITAYLGVQDIGRPKAGETMVVSSAAGAVGSVAGQIGLARELA